MVGQANSTCKRRIAMHTCSKLHRHTYHSKENYNPVLTSESEIFLKCVEMYHNKDGLKKKKNVHWIRLT